jgi:thioredoxin reductase
LAGQERAVIGHVANFITRMRIHTSRNCLIITSDKAGVVVTDRGFVPVDKQMRTNVSDIFAIGDIVGQPMLADKVMHEAHGLT